MPFQALPRVADQCCWLVNWPFQLWDSIIYLLLLLDARYASLKMIFVFCGDDLRKKLIVAYPIASGTCRPSTPERVDGYPRARVLHKDKHWIFAVAS
jgi:hypothetical protein